MGFGRIRELDPLLVKIDGLQAAVNTAKAERPDAYDRIMDSWAIESTYNSNNIEGSMLSLGDTALLYDGVQVDGPVDDIRQAEGGFAALRFLKRAISNGECLSEGLIKRAHELTYAEAGDPLERGRYRSIEVEITGSDFETAPAIYVPERMADLVSSCVKSKRHTVITAALFHQEFETIHPFVNGNGRTGRIVLNYMLESAGYPPIAIKAAGKTKYLSALEAWQVDDNPAPLLELTLQSIEEETATRLEVLRETRKAVAQRDA